MVTVPAALRPQHLAEAREALRETAGARLAITGAGTARGWGGAAGQVDAALDTTGLARVVSYQPADLTVAVQAGIALAELQAVLAEQGQRVALDAARIPAGATAGGLLATGDAGPARLAYGSLRDLVIGVTVLLADGTVARSGGHVIKNVAGYDLAKLFHGSLGTLGLVAELVLRLHPLPPATATLVAECDPEAGATLAGALLAEALEPVAVEWCAGRLLARFEGTEGGLAARGRAARRIAGATADWQTPGDQPWQEPARLARGEDGDTVLRLGLLPAHGPWLARRVPGLAAGGPVAAELSSSVLVGVHQLRLRGGTAVEHAALAGALREEVAARGGTTTVCRWTEGLAELLPAWGEPPEALPLLRAVKQAFDPEGRLEPGRFAPWF